jgi:hypothetical protein
MSAFSTFALTTALIGLLIGISLRSGSAENSAPADPSVLHFPVFAIGGGAVAHIKVVNVSTDPTSPAVTFMVSAFDESGAQIKPATTCQIRAGQTCDVPFTVADCGVTIPDRGCELRADVIAEPQPAPPNTDSPTTDSGTGGGATGGPFFANLTIANPNGSTAAIASPVVIYPVPTS